MISKKIAVLITEAFKDFEYTAPAQIYKQAGHHVVTIEKQPGNTGPDKKVEVTTLLIKVLMMFMPRISMRCCSWAGITPDSLRSDDRFVNFTRAFANSSKPIFVICHGS